MKNKRSSGASSKEQIQQVKCTIFGFGEGGSTIVMDSMDMLLNELNVVGYREENLILNDISYLFDRKKARDSVGDYYSRSTFGSALVAASNMVQTTCDPSIYAQVYGAGAGITKIQTGEGDEITVVKDSQGRIPASQNEELFRYAWKGESKPVKKDIRVKDKDIPGSSVLREDVLVGFDLNVPLYDTSICIADINPHSKAGIAALSDSSWKNVFDGKLGEAIGYVYPHQCIYAGPKVLEDVIAKKLGDDTHNDPLFGVLYITNNLNDAPNEKVKLSIGTGLVDGNVSQVYVSAAGLGGCTGTIFHAYAMENMIKGVQRKLGIVDKLKLKLAYDQSEPQLPIVLYHAPLPNRSRSHTSHMRNSANIMAKQFGKFLNPNETNLGVCFLPYANEIEDYSKWANMEKNEKWEPLNQRIFSSSALLLNSIKNGTRNTRNAFPVTINEAKTILNGPCHTYVGFADYEELNANSSTDLATEALKNAFIPGLILGQGSSSFYPEEIEGLEGIATTRTQVIDYVNKVLNGQEPSNVPIEFASPSKMLTLTFGKKVSAADTKINDTIRRLFPNSNMETKKYIAEVGGGLEGICLYTDGITTDELRTAQNLDLLFSGFKSDRLKGFLNHKILYKEIMPQNAKTWYENPENKQYKGHPDYNKMLKMAKDLDMIASSEDAKYFLVELQKGVDITKDIFEQ